MEGERGVNNANTNTTGQPLYMPKQGECCVPDHVSYDFPLSLSTFYPSFIDPHYTCPPSVGQVEQARFMMSECISFSKANGLNALWDSESLYSSQKEKHHMSLLSSSRPFYSSSPSLTAKQCRLPFPAHSPLKRTILPLHVNHLHTTIFTRSISGRQLPHLNQVRRWEPSRGQSDLHPLTRSQATSIGHLRE